MTEFQKLYDNFSDSQLPGSVIGSFSNGVHSRLGVDIENVMSIDNGALRIAPLIKPGWGRAVLSYGPFVHQPGLAFAVYILNGHNTAQAEPLPETLRKRLERWLKGSETDSPSVRLFRWLFSGRIKRTFRQFRIWNRMASIPRPSPLLDENLAVGWFGHEVEQNPQLQGNTFIMHALGPENGELWTGPQMDRSIVIRGVANLPLYLVAIARPGGHVYYASSLSDMGGIAPYPALRPIAVDNCVHYEKVYLGIHQSVLGQIGFRMDTRLKGVRVDLIEGYESWHGGAHVADRFENGEPQDGAEAEIGGKWTVHEWQDDDPDTLSAFSRRLKVLLLDPGESTGLVSALLNMNEASPRQVGIVWRWVDERNHWRVERLQRTSKIILVVNGESHVLASRENPNLNVGQKGRLQVLDDGRNQMAYVDGEPVAKGWITDSRFKRSTGVGILLDDSADAQKYLHSFEAHCRQIIMPNALDMGEPWRKVGTREVITDDFEGAYGDLEGRISSTGRREWSRLIGKGIIEVTGDRSARVRGSVKNPCPERTAYCVEWEYSEFAELEVTIIPPGTKRGQKEHSTAGFILYQDEDNYVTVNVWLDDCYEGASVSSFFKLDGFEDVYDAIWVNVGNRVSHGQSLCLRLCCDGDQYIILINDEPVLYRAFKDIYANIKRVRISKIGLIANWEWGTDTGSIFEKFRARA